MGARFCQVPEPAKDAVSAISNEKRRNIEGFIFLALFCLTIPAANWMIGHVGTVCSAKGPCLVPVAPGILAPSGVLMIGAALVLRDLVQRRLGVEFGIAAIVAGAAISVGVAPASLVVASATAFLLSEFADFAVYTPLARRRLVTAVVASSTVGLVVDSTSCSARSSARPGWCCWRYRWSHTCAVATSGSA